MIARLLAWLRTRRAARIAAEQRDYKAQRDAGFARWRDRSCRP